MNISPRAEAPQLRGGQFVRREVILRAIFCAPLFFAIVIFCDRYLLLTVSSLPKNQLTSNKTQLVLLADSPAGLGSSTQLAHGQKPRPGDRPGGDRLSLVAQAKW